VAVLGRCTEHKKRNILEHLPKGERRWVQKALWQAWHLPDAEEAERELRGLIAELEPRWPEAAASLREGLLETLTCQRLGLPRALVDALSSIAPRATRDGIPAAGIRGHISGHARYSHERARSRISSVYRESVRCVRPRGPGGSQSEVRARTRPGAAAAAGRKTRWVRCPRAGAGGQRRSAPPPGPGARRRDSALRQLLPASFAKACALETNLCAAPHAE
jgi:hypothetical protein